MVKKLLIADDQPECLSYVIDALKGLYDVEVVESGDDALERIGQDGLDFIILDNDMSPGPKGKEIAKVVRSSYPNLPILLQSSESGKYREEMNQIGVEVRHKCDTYGIVDYVTTTLGDVNPLPKPTKDFTFIGE
jgi:CheY-like chemotaxis protein